jgi:hypothetical protein
MSEFHSAALLPGYENPARTEIRNSAGQADYEVEV